MWDSSSNTAMGSPTTNSYTYGDSSWTDSLTKYKGEEITYDEIGNPIAYRDGMTFSWENGRQLATLTKDDKTTSYTYDVSGIRTQKNVDGTITKYYYDDSNNLVSMTVGDKTLMFYYDQNGSVNSVLYNGVMYYYIKSLQGDIMRIVDENGNNIAIYAYDQWGRPTTMRKPSTTTVDLVNYNPFLYRGYVYDADSGLYYLQSRYYDPTTGRFLNADVFMNMGSSLGCNLFAYCENNHVNCVDYSGYFTFRIGKSHYYQDEIYLFLYLTDYDVRLIKLGITTTQLIAGALFAAASVVLGALSYGIGALVTALAGIAVEAILGLINAYIDFYNNGKGATVIIFVRCGTIVFRELVWYRTWYGYWRRGIKKHVVPYLYLSRMPRIIWRR